MIFFGCRPDGGRSLSAVYCVIVVLLSVVISVKEALEETWMTEYTVAVSSSWFYIALCVEKYDKTLSRNIFSFIEHCTQNISSGLPVKNEQGYLIVVTVEFSLNDLH